MNLVGFISKGVVVHLMHVRTGMAESHQLRAGWVKLTNDHIGTFLKREIVHLKNAYIAMKGYHPPKNGSLRIVQSHAPIS